MKIQKIIDEVQNTVENLQVQPDNLIMAIQKLLEITHAHGLDKEAADALAECGITLEIAEEV